MSNNDEPDVKKYHGRGILDSNKTTDGHGVRGKRGSHHGTSENERKQRHLEQYQSKGNTGVPNADEANKQWTEVDGRAKGGTQKPTDQQDNRNRVGTISGGAYLSNDTHSIFENRNGNIFGQDAARGVDSNPNLTTNTTTVEGMEHYRVNVGYDNVPFMCGNRKGFNVARGIKQFIAATRSIDKYFCLLPMGAKTTTFVFWQTSQT
jgi:hypothetical protein